MPVHKLCILSCQNFRRELVSVVESEGLNDVQIVSFPSRCGHPQIQWNELRRILKNRHMDFDRIQILGGCCISSFGAPPEDLSQCHVSKMDQCFYLLAPQSIIDGYLKNGAYLLTPGWLMRWRHHLDKWGFDQETAKEFFHESVSRLVLLDTGTIPESCDHLKDFSEFLDIPFDILPIGLDYLKLFLKNIVFEWQLVKRKEEESELAGVYRQLADYALIFDLIGKITGIMSEKEAIENIFELFTALFAPDRMVFLSLKEGKLESITFHPAPFTYDEHTGSHLLESHDNSDWIETESGFLLRFIHQDETVGFLEIDGFAFPKYKAHYMNLGLVLARVCGLAIYNARTYRLLLEEKEKYRKYLEKQKQQEQILIHQSKLATMGEMIGAIAHQWRQPLNAVGLIIQDIQDCYQYGELDEKGFQAKMDMTMAQLLFMSKTIDDFKSFFRPSKEKVSFNVIRALSESLSIVSVQFVDNFIRSKFHCQICGNTFNNFIEITSICEVYVLGYPNEFKQVILNLLNNSKDAILEQREKGFMAREDGQIFVSIRLGEDKLTIEIRDDAGGIRPEIVGRIFEPYFTTKEQERGTGIGLYMSKIIIENNMSGKLYAENTANGARFIIELPTHSEQ